ADRVGSELQPRVHGCLDDGDEAFSRNEEDAAIVRIGDRVDTAEAPRLAHVGAASEHAAVQVGLDADDAEQRVRLAERGCGDAADVAADLVERADSVDMVRDGNADGEGATREEAAVALDLVRARVTVADAGDTGGVVVAEEGQEAFLAVLLAGLAAGGADLH